MFEIFLFGKIGKKCSVRINSAPNYETIMQTKSKVHEHKKAASHIRVDGETELLENNDVSQLCCSKVKRSAFCHCLLMKYLQHVCSKDNKIQQVLIKNF